jgi:hypothetical protein
MWDKIRADVRESKTRETLTRRGGLRVVAQGLCSEINEDDEQLGLLVDLSEHGLRLERPHLPQPRLGRERVVQLEFEHPAVDELIWAKGVIRYDKLEPVREGSTTKVRRTSGVEIVSAASRHLRMLREFVLDLRTGLRTEMSEPALPSFWSTAFRLG